MRNLILKYDHAALSVAAQFLRMRGKTAMLALLALLCLFAPLAECQYEYEEPLLYDTFPDGFMWGGNLS